MSDRSIPIWRPRAWLRTVDSERLATAVLAGGLLITMAALILGGFVQYGSGTVSILYSLAILLPAIGVLLVLGALWWGLSALKPTEPRLAGADPPEWGTTRTNQRVARETIWTLERATSNWYHCRDEGATDEVRERLTAGAIRALRSTCGLERERTREAVQRGTWTDDPVAGAFLAADLSQPLGERLRAMIDPGAAFDRRLRRTLAAIDSIADDPQWQPPVAGEELSPESTPETATESTTSTATTQPTSLEATATETRTSTRADSSERLQEVSQ